MHITTRTKLKIVVGFLAILASFLLGFFLQHRQASELESQLESESSRVESLESDAKLTSVRDLASALFLETVNQNYGTASSRASQLFNRVGSVAADPAAAEYRGPLEGILTLRDSVIASLAKPDPSAEKQVQDILERALRIGGPLKAAGST